MAHESLSEIHRQLVDELEMSALAVRSTMRIASVRKHQAHTMAHVAAYVTGSELGEFEAATLPFEAKMAKIWREGLTAFYGLNSAIFVGGGKRVEGPNITLTPRRNPAQQEAEERTNRQLNDILS